MQWNDHDSEGDEGDDGAGDDGEGDNGEGDDDGDDGKGDDGEEGDDEYSPYDAEVLGGKWAPSVCPSLSICKWTLRILHISLQNMIQSLAPSTKRTLFRDMHFHFRT